MEREGAFIILYLQKGETEVQSKSSDIAQGAWELGWTQGFGSKA